MASTSCSSELQKSSSASRRPSLASRRVSFLVTDNDNIITSRRSSAASRRSSTSSGFSLSTSQRSSLALRTSPMPQVTEDVESLAAVSHLFNGCFGFLSTAVAGCVLISLIQFLAVGFTLAKMSLCRRARDGAQFVRK